MTKSVVTCDCAKVAIELDGAPFISTECHCKQLPAAAARLEQLPLARPMREPNAGTRFVLYRKDRIEILRGRELLEAFPARAESANASGDQSVLQQPDLSRIPEWPLAQPLFEPLARRDTAKAAAAHDDKRQNRPSGAR